MSEFRDKDKAETAAWVARMKKQGIRNRWADANRRHPEHYADINEMHEVATMMDEVNLQRWSPETRTKIRGAREWITDAYRGMYAEAEDRFES